MFAKTSKLSILNKAAVSLPMILLLNVCLIDKIAVITNESLLILATMFSNCRKPRNVVDFLKDITQLTVPKMQRPSAFNDR